MWKGGREGGGRANKDGPVERGDEHDVARVGQVKQVVSDHRLKHAVNRRHHEREVELDAVLHKLLHLRVDVMG